ncbi:MAG TPA: CotH kinase family protein, partial [bacterium]|nr:CotH kinase family protein [bacterium]
ATTQMARIEGNTEEAVFQCVIPPCPSQTLVRFYLQVALTDGTDVQLPPLGEPRPFESYFVYDNEIHAELPLLWIFPTNRTGASATTQLTAGVVVKPVTSEQVLVFDGARIESSRPGQKIRFLKGEEFRGDRTINLILGNPSVGRAGVQPSHVEHISHRLFRDFGVLAPRCDWYRVIENNEHTQRIAIQQPNERFLEINGRDDEGNIYKIPGDNHFLERGVPSFSYTKQTNADEDCEDLLRMVRAINASDEAARGRALRAYLNVEEVMAYSVVSIFVANWDGFHNNMFLYHNPAPIDRWECVPWDLDQTFGFVNGGGQMIEEIPLDYPFTGISSITKRPLGVISRPFHGDSELDAAYRDWLGRELNGLLSEQRIGDLIAETETLLLSDLDLTEQYLGVQETKHREEILRSCEAMRTFLRLRHEYLRSQLPVSIEDWQIH